MDDKKRRGSICFDINRQKWRVRITLNHKRHLIGLFTDQATAESALADTLHDINAGHFMPPADIRRSKREARNNEAEKARAASLARRRANWLKSLPRPDFDD